MHTSFIWNIRIACLTYLGEGTPLKTYCNFEKYNKIIQYRRIEEFILINYSRKQLHLEKQ